jgi:hypothetical protein
MKAQQIFKHENLDFDYWLKSLFTVERFYTQKKRKKARTTVLRRY